MKKTKFILGLLPVVIGLTGCGGNDGPDNRRVLTIECVQGGFGDEPYRQLANAFMEEHKDVRIDLVPNRNMDSTCGAEIENGTCSDLMIYNRDVSTIRLWATKGLVLDLTDLFNEPIDTDNNTILSQLDDNGKRISEYKGKYYTVPEFYNINGFVYDENLFNWYKNKDSKIKIPETTSELEYLCQKVSELTPSRSPLVYCKSADGYLYYADLGFDVSYEGTANMEKFFKYESVEVFNPTNRTGKIKALDMQNKLFFQSGFSYGDSWAIDNKQAQNMLFSGDAFMMLNGSWFENEMADVIKENPTANMKMFAVPEMSDASGDPIHAPGYTCEQGKNKVISAECNTNYFIPAKAKNISDAKEFLKFSCRKSSCEIWTKYSNAVRPLKYDYSTTNPVYAGMSDFGKSVLNIATTNCLYVPTSSADIAIGGATYRPQGYWFKSMMENPTKYTGTFCVNSDYTNVKNSQWSVWEESARAILG